MKAWHNIALALVISFTIPTLTVANKWGAQEMMYEHLIDKVELIHQDTSETRSKVGEMNIRLSVLEALREEDKTK